MTLVVIAITITMMVVEITSGFIFGSMALLADGWHMATHTIALGITLFAYSFSRKNIDNPRYSFGTGKVGVLGGFASAVSLAVVALFMIIESVERLFSPEDIHFNEAILVAVIGLVVNLVSAILLQGSGGHHHHHHHGHEHSHDHSHGHVDHNLKAAYMHVVADALTSFFAIIALLTGKFWGLNWLDPVMGIVGALVIVRWAYGLVKDTAGTLLDSGVEPALMERVKGIVEADRDNRVTDLHLWKLGGSQVSAIISLVTHYPQPPFYYKELLEGVEELEHITVEVNPAEGEPCQGE